MEEQLLKSTTRHIRIFSAEVNRDGELVPNNHVLTLDVDPDNEFNWNDALQEVYRKFDGLVESHSGDDLADYTYASRLRLGAFNSLTSTRQLSYITSLGVSSTTVWGILSCRRRANKNFCYALTSKVRALKSCWYK